MAPNNPPPPAYSREDWDCFAKIHRSVFVLMLFIGLAGAALIFLPILFLIAIPFVLAYLSDKDEWWDPLVQWIETKQNIKREVAQTKVRTALRLSVALSFVMCLLVLKFVVVHPLIRADRQRLENLAQVSIDTTNKILQAHLPRLRQHCQTACEGLVDAWSLSPLYTCKDMVLNCSTNATFFWKMTHDLPEYHFINTQQDILIQATADLERLRLAELHLPDCPEIIEKLAVSSGHALRNSIDPKAAYWFGGTSVFWGTSGWLADRFSTRLHGYGITPTPVLLSLTIVYLGGLALAKPYADFSNMSHVVEEAFHLNQTLEAFRESLSLSKPWYQNAMTIIFETSGHTLFYLCLVGAAVVLYLAQRPWYIVYLLVIQGALRGLMWMFHTTLVGTFGILLGFGLIYLARDTQTQIMKQV